MDRNKILIGVSGVLLVGAVVVYYSLSGEEQAPTPDDVETTMTKIACESCGESYDIPFSEAKEYVQDAAQEGRKFKCEKCGQQAAWIQPSMDMSKMPKPTQKDIDESIGNPPTPVEDPANEGQVPEEKAVPTAAPMFDPNLGKGGG